MAVVGRMLWATAILAVLGMYFLLRDAFPAMGGADREVVMEAFNSLSSRLGPWTLPAFVVVHALTISLCLPSAVVFEAGAAYLLGFRRGVVCVFSAKVLGASLSFWVGRALFRSSKAASNWIKKNKYFNVISEGVARDGWKFVLLARFSPVPSYVINYGIAATNVRFFVDFLLPTVFGGIPMILQNTSIGSLTSAATHTGGDSKNTGGKSYVFPVIALFSSVMITWRIKKYASNASVSLEQSVALNSPSQSLQEEPPLVSQISSNKGKSTSVRQRNNCTS